MSWIEYEPQRVEAIAARLDLRDANRRALHEVAEHLVEGDGREFICDLATGVGKTYLAAGVLEYLAEAGIRNVVMIVPLDAIYEKTIQNFTPGSRKYIEGAVWEPVVVTAENFRQHVDDMNDLTKLKLFIFKVQTLLKPSDDMRRKIHDENESMGEALYAHLQWLDDLVVLADEHHVYSGDAEKYGATIRDLGARAIVGLTATPNKADVRAGKVVFRYTLAEAIADGLVKIPVVVYREDGTKDTRSQLADACHLRDVKEAAWRAYARASAKATVVPVLFVVCEEVKKAEQIAETLRAEFLTEPDQVLLITGGSSDKALRSLKAVEDPTSPVRAVVSVDKLKEGWDVRNIGVIVSFRPLLSATLTEQVLGRGLRLPFGERTSIEAIDTVDIVAHESYRQLLASKQALLEQVLEERAVAAKELSTTSAVKASGEQPQGPVASAMTQRGLTFVFDDAHGGEVVDPSVLLMVQEYNTTVEQQEKGTAATVQFVSPVNNAPRIKFPRLERQAIPTKFSLSCITQQQSRDLGSKYLSDESVYMKRVALDAERGIDGEVVIGERFLEEEKAHIETLPWSTVKKQLETKVLGLSVITSTLTEFQAASNVIGWFLDGAGVTGDEHVRWSVKRTALATRAIEAMIIKAYELRATTPTWEFNVVEVPVLPPSRPMPSPILSKWADFAKGVWYGDWQKSVENVSSFDARTTEFSLAQMLDSAAHVKWWLRIYTNGPAWIEWEGGRYFADFIAIDTNGHYWLIEGKADDDANDESVMAKRKAAEAWVEQVNEVGAYGQWRYLFATETAIKVSNGRWLDLIKQ
ncbi:type iii restriction res subunit [Streptomyces xiamenensis]|uniref:Type iii restriction res subunit n=1 Tax=Streptomyces xiamenensis TaxID=408015 RepID=A0A0F7FY74_9ACTN|nr:DEAD/DEAH box helicase family protein [Streptomyces xiamenensis]AKG45492.1 type iii restriction res subunit [Streptomyces xiamenensis]